MNSNYINQEPVVLHRMAWETETSYWNDSCSIESLEASILNGAVGATTNPFIISDVYTKEEAHWKLVLQDIIKAYPQAGEDMLAKLITKEIAGDRAGFLGEMSEACRKSLAVQTDPRNAFHAAAMVEEGVELSDIASNIYVKIPATKAGLDAIRELTSKGINILATVCFSVSQVLAVADAVEHGLALAREEGVDLSSLKPLCAVMIGRLDDWLKDLCKIEIKNPDEALDWAGIAVIKKAYRILEEKKSSLKLMSAAYRNLFHWSELVGGNLIQTIPPAWQEKINNVNGAVVDRMNEDVPRHYINYLQDNFKDFVHAYEEDGLSVENFDTFPPGLITLRQFLLGSENLNSMIRDIRVPDPRS